MFSHFFFAPMDDTTMEMELVMEDLESTLKSFKKDKSPSPDGWTVELFVFF